MPGGNNAEETDTEGILWFAWLVGAVSPSGFKCKVCGILPSHLKKCRLHYAIRASEKMTLCTMLYDDKRSSAPLTQSQQKCLFLSLNSLYCLIATHLRLCVLAGVRRRVLCRKEWSLRAIEPAEPRPTVHDVILHTENVTIIVFGRQ